MTNIREEPFELRITLPAPAPTVWAHLRRPELIRRWHGWETDGLDDEIQSVYLDCARVDVEDRSVRIGGHLFELMEAGSETTLTVTRCNPVDGSDWSAYYTDIDQGWISFLEQLRLVLKRQPEGPRGGWIRSGEQAIDDWNLLQEARNLEDAYPDTELWFETSHQLGVVARSVNALVIVARSPHDRDECRTSALWFASDREERNAQRAVGALLARP